MSRKYRQRGYQDEDREGAGRSPKSHLGAERGAQGPRGRGLGRPQRQEFRCRNCRQPQPHDRIDEALACSRCQASLHSCVHCASFDPSARWECRAEISERISSKSEGNSCQLFEPRLVIELGEGRPDDLRGAFDALFD